MWRWRFMHSNSTTFTTAKLLAAKQRKVMDDYARELHVYHIIFPAVGVIKVV